MSKLSKPFTESNGHCITDVKIVQAFHWIQPLDDDVKLPLILMSKRSKPSTGSNYRRHLTCIRITYTPRFFTILDGTDCKKHLNTLILLIREWELQRKLGIHQPFGYWLKIHSNWLPGGLSELQKIQRQSIKDLINFSQLYRNLTRP